MGEVRTLVVFGCETFCVRFVPAERGRQASVEQGSSVMLFVLCIQTTSGRTGIHIDVTVKLYLGLHVIWGRALLVGLNPRFGSAAHTAVVDPELRRIRKDQGIKRIELKHPHQYPVFSA